MEATTSKGVLREIGNIDNSNIPEGIGVAEDSGFASIAGSEAEPHGNAETNSINQNIKFRAMDENDKKDDRGIKRKLIVDERQRQKREADEKYNSEKREQTYKQLMHLLTKSQFYSKYIVDKINGTETPKKKAKPKQTTKNVKDNPDEIFSPRQSTRPRKGNKKYDIKEYVSNDMKKKLNEQTKKMNLSQEEIEAELGNNSDTENAENAAPAKFKNPKYFEGELRDYQIEGLQWLKVLYENGVNGILADEMGLGKTIQVIALYSHLLEKRQDGPYLIVAPLSTIPNWLMEFERFAPKLPVVLFHGKPAVRAEAAKKMRRKVPIGDGYSTYPIFLTTFEVPIVERAFITTYNWRYIVIDEGHRIKNHECQLLKVLNNSKSMNRLLLTGTPLQNNLTELWSLLNFLLPEIFNDLEVFESWFDVKELQQDGGTAKVLKQEEETQVISTLREILRPFMLRRVKTDVCLEIPAKKELIVYAPLTELQHDLYCAVLNRDLAALSKIEEESLIIDSGPTRPKRKCVSRKNSDALYAERANQSYLDSPMPSPNGFDDDSYAEWDRNANMSITSKNSTKDAETLAEWGKYTDINQRNLDFFIRLRWGAARSMYRQIVNHPFLVHCPLDSAGLPEISENLVRTSGKLLVLDAMLKKLKQRGHKVLLFSTSVMLLELVADYLSMRPWKFVSLNGKHDIAVRQVNIKAFNEDPEIFLFLISTRAGGVGLNLMAADTVIIYDSDWNPQADLQAMARCHRIGQTRPVVVYRLCTKGTIDEDIITRAEGKRKLEKMVISKQPGLDLRDVNKLKLLKELLASTESSVVTAEKEVYTDAELDQILDRSDLIGKKGD